MRRQRTIKSNLNRLATKYAANVILNGGVDLEAVRKRQSAIKENDAQGLDTCWHCNAGVSYEADKCDKCSVSVVPF